MNRRASQSIVANPVLVGAVTTLVVIVAVFLAYNANTGLPFVPVKQYFAQFSSGSNLVNGNEVREGGFRQGIVEDIEPVVLEDGTTAAQMKITLDREYGTLPIDTTLEIRPRSALGLKYVELTRGSSQQNFNDGDTIPVDQTNVPVQFDDIYKAFDEPTREAAVRNLDGYGNAFTGRGIDLNLTIAELPPLFRRLTPVARNLAAPNTELDRFFAEIGDTVRVIAPIADVQADLFTQMAITFEAFSRDPAALAATIERQPGTLRVGTESLRVQRPFLVETALFSRDLRFAVGDLVAALPDLNSALDIGTPTLRRAVQLNDDLQDALGALEDLVRAPTTNAALRGLTATVTTLNPQLRFYGPYVTVCNSFTYFWTNVFDHVSVPDPTGTAQAALLNSAGSQTNSVTSLGATEPANGVSYNPLTARRGDIQFLHAQPFAAAVNNDGTADCENGQRGYPEGPLAFFGDPQYKIVVDPHTPGSQGPTFAGRERVLPGQTFTRDNETGDQLPEQLTTGIYSGDVK